MHALGVEHAEVRKVVRGIESETERFWRVLGDREALLSGEYYLDSNSGVKQEKKCSKKDDRSDAVDATVVLTADHGHVTVQPKDMVVLPADSRIIGVRLYRCSWQRSARIFALQSRSTKPIAAEMAHNR